MAIEAPFSKFKRQNLIIYMVLCIAAGAWFGYDGYFDQEFIEKHTKTVEETGEKVPDDTLLLNQKAPYAAGVLVLIFAVQLVMKMNKKVVAGDKELVVDGKTTVLYDNIEKIDKTNFAGKGFFVVHYKVNETEQQLKLSKKDYDNMESVLDRLVQELT